jgi:hypothetical protein
VSSEGKVVGEPGVVVCIDHRKAAHCHRDHKSGRCICRGVVARDPRRRPEDPNECQEC